MANANDSFSAALVTDYALQNIVTPTNNDVLCGRGGFTNNHLGNCNWRGLVALNKRLYISLPKQQKISVAKSIVKTVRDQDPPGRFLQKNKKNNLWHDIGEQKAIFKTSQALREGAPDLRNEINKEKEASNKIVKKLDPTGNPIILPPFFPGNLINSSRRNEAQTASDTISSAMIASQVLPGATCMSSNLKPYQSMYPEVNPALSASHDKNNINWFGSRNESKITASKPYVSYEVRGLPSQQFHQNINTYCSNMTPLQQNTSDSDVSHVRYLSHPREGKKQEICHTNSDNYGDTKCLRSYTEETGNQDSCRLFKSCSSQNSFYKNQVQTKNELAFNKHYIKQNKRPFSMDNDKIYPEENIKKQKKIFLKQATPTTEISTTIKNKYIHTNSLNYTDANTVSYTNHLMTKNHSGVLSKSDSSQNTFHKVSSQLCTEYKIPSIVNESGSTYPVVNKDTTKSSTMKPKRPNNESSMNLNLDFTVSDLSPNELSLTELSRNHSLAFSDVSIDDFTSDLDVFGDNTHITHGNMLDSSDIADFCISA